MPVDCHGNVFISSTNVMLERSDFVVIVCVCFAFRLLDGVIDYLKESVKKKKGSKCNYLLLAVTKFIFNLL